MTHVKSFVFTGDRNSTKPDYVGAFDPEAKHFMKKWNIPAECRLKVDLSKNEQARRKQVLDFVENLRSKGYTTDSFAFFCHGYTNRVELGFKIANIPQLVNAARSVSTPNSNVFYVPLYCCSTGDGPGKEGDNGFADRLRDVLCQAGFVNCVVDAHVTAGHTTQNPLKRRYLGMGSPVGGVGGVWIVAPRTPLAKKFRAALKTPQRFEYAYMTIGEIHTTLLANP